VDAFTQMRSRTPGRGYISWRRRNPLIGSHSVMSGRQLLLVAGVVGPEGLGGHEDRRQPRRERCAADEPIVSCASSILRLTLLSSLCLVPVYGADRSKRPRYGPECVYNDRMENGNDGLLCLKIRAINVGNAHTSHPVPSTRGSDSLEHASLG
jgi:hypothetical protein